MSKEINNKISLINTFERKKETPVLQDLLNSILDKSAKKYLEKLNSANGIDFSVPKMYEDILELLNSLEQESKRENSNILLKNISYLRGCPKNPSKMLGFFVYNFKIKRNHFGYKKYLLLSYISLISY